ncbi:hypothetical protein Ancab_038631 [Ancistrocladus abbreviatus]
MLDMMRVCTLHHQPSSGPEELFHAVNPESSKSPVHANKTKQFVPFISPPSLTSTLFPDREINSPPSLSRTKSNAKVDLQDVLAAAETAEHAAAAARSAASLAEGRSFVDIYKRAPDATMLTHWWIERNKRPIN